MLDFDDDRWNHLTGGYKMPWDARPWLRKLEKREDTAEFWYEFWGEVHHQGDVGTGSYATVPELVRIYRDRTAIDWNFYAMIATIDLARTENGNPPLPDWLKEDYFTSIRELAKIGASQIMSANDTEAKRAILSVIAISKDLRVHGKFLIEFSEEELLEINPLWAPKALSRIQLLDYQLIHRARRELASRRLHHLANKECRHGLLATFILREL